MNKDVRLALTLQRRLPAVLLCGAAAVALLTGCTGQTTGLSLAETKASAQLLRNNVLANIDAKYVIGFVEWRDQSKACGDPAEDPEELMRSWYSSGQVPIAPLYMSETASIIDEVAVLYADRGWTVENEGDATVLTKPGSSSTITLTVVPITKQVRIESEGPCVATGGPDSDEVTTLEAP